VRRRSLVEVVALVAAVVVAAAAIAQAVREHSVEPILTVGWIPAVLVASVGGRGGGRWNARNRQRRTPRR
jgi:hypothetical protein